jgi:hypothetical protein
MNREYLITNSVLLANLDTYINEDQISGSIIELNNEINRIESVSGPSRRTNKMRNEIAKLEDQLAYSKNQGKIRTQQFRMKNSRSKEE